MMTAHKIWNIFLVCGLVAGVFTHAGTALASQKIEIRELKMVYVGGKPELQFQLVNNDFRKTRVLGKMVVRDRLTGQAREVYNGELAVIDSGKTKDLSFIWDEEWKGFGLPLVKLEAWEDGKAISPMTAEAGFIFAPSLLTTVGIVSILALGGRGGMLLISKIA